MEPNKFEQDIRQKMEQRSIQPTEMAWDRLDAMLSVTEDKKKKPNRTWMYMAASFLALLLVGTLFLNREKENGINNTNSVVTTEKQPEVNEEVNPIQVVPQTVTEQEAVAATTPAKTESRRANGTTKTSKTAVKYLTTTNEGIDVEVAFNEPAVITPKVAPKTIRVDANNLLASVDSKTTVKPANNNAVAVNPEVKQPSVKVNPNSLLTSVEGELNESFRMRVLHTVSKNYDKVKTSVATRNHQ